jgi:hypothetical protein
MDNLEVITRITYLLFIYLLLAVFVERLLEVLVSIFNYVELKRNLYPFWNRKAEIYQKRFDRLYGYQGSNAPQTHKILNWVLWKVVSERTYVGGKEIISAELIRVNHIRVGVRVLSFLISLGFAWFIKIKLQIDLVTIIENLLPENVMFGKIVDITRFDTLRVLLTAAAISIGTEPLHQIISDFEKFAQRKSTAAQGGSK